MLCLGLAYRDGFGGIKKSRVEAHRWIASRFVRDDANQSSGFRQIGSRKPAPSP
jgi:hypothetical protein